MENFIQESAAGASAINGLFELALCDLMECEIDAFLANVWSAAKLSERQLRIAGEKSDARTAFLTVDPLSLIDERCELLFAVMLLQRFGAELQLFAQPVLANGRQTSCCHLTRVMRGRSQFGILPDIRETVKSFVQNVCQDTEFDVLCWGSELSESIVQAVLNGTHTKLADVSKVLRAAGFHLHLVVVNERAQMTIGDQRFQVEHRDLYQESQAQLSSTKISNVAGFESSSASHRDRFRTASAARSRSGISTMQNSWKVLIGDMQ